jgi:uncharacterized protein DUF3592
MAVPTNQPMPTWVRIFLFRALPLACWIGGALLLYFGLRNLLWARESTSWPTAKGTIVSSDVHEDREWDNNTGRERKSYGAQVHYTYVVDGKTIEGTRVAFGDYASENSEHAQGIVDRYPRGKDVTVYYQPEDPSEGLLEPGLLAQAWVLPGLGLGVLIFGGFLVLMSHWQSAIQVRTD